MSKENKRIRAVVEEVGAGQTTTESDQIEAVVPKTETMPTPETEATPEAPVIKSNPEVKDDAKVEKKRTNFKLILIITILTALVVGFVSGGVYVYFTGVKQAQTGEDVEATATPAPTTETTPSPTPAPEDEDIDLSVYKLSILNGSGKIGEAGKARDVVEKVGFTVEDTGNAASFNFEETIVEAKVDVPKSIVAMVSDALEESYAVELGDELTEDSDYDIVITVGAKSN